MVRHAAATWVLATYVGWRLGDIGFWSSVSHMYSTVDIPFALSSSANTLEMFRDF